MIEFLIYAHGWGHDRITKRDKSGRKKSALEAFISYAGNEKPYLLSVTKDCGVVGGDLKSTDKEEVEIHVAAQDRST